MKFWLIIITVLIGLMWVAEQNRGRLGNQIGENISLIRGGVHASQNSSVQSVPYTNQQAELQQVLYTILDAIPANCRQAKQDWISFIEQKQHSNLSDSLIEKELKKIQQFCILLK